MKTPVIVIVVAAVGAAVVLGLVGGLADLVGQSSRQVTLPAPTGPYRVGRTLAYWTDRTRLDPYAPRRATHRELPVLIWYPANPRSGSKPASYLPPGWTPLMHPSGLVAILQTPPGNIHPHAVEDAPLQPGRQRFPLLIFEPGLGLATTDYTTLVEDVASHGFVIAGIDPTYSTDVVLAGGRVVPSIPDARDNANYTQLTGVWAADMRFVAAQLARLDTASRSRFYHRLDVHDVGFFGHSAGGAAATLACRDVPVCGGAADIDGDLAGRVIDHGLGKPFLFLAVATAFSHEPYLKGMIRGVVRDVPSNHVFVFTLHDAGHFSFSDRKLYFSVVYSLLGRSSSADPTRLLRVTARYIEAFFRTAWGARAPALLLHPHDPLVQRLWISG